MSNCSSGKTATKYDDTYENLQRIGFILIQNLESITLIFMILVFIFFGYHFWKKTIYISTVYFHLCGISLLVGIISLIWKDISWATDFSKQWIEAASSFFQWYTSQLSAIWVFTISINRLTSILFWQRHNQLWSRLFIPIVIFMLIYPFLINGYSFINYKCRFFFKGCKDPNYWQEDAMVTAIANVTVAVMSMIISLWGFRQYILQFRKNLSGIENVERKLVLQALASSIIFVGYSGLRLLGLYARQASKDYYCALGYWAAQLSMTLPYVIFQLSTFLLIFAFSSHVRKRFLEFYRLSSLYQMVSPSSSVITISSNS